MIRVKMTKDDMQTLDPGVAGEVFVGTTWGDKAALTAITNFGTASANYGIDQAGFDSSAEQWFSFTTKDSSTLLSSAQFTGTDGVTLYSYDITNGSDRRKWNLILKPKPSGVILAVILWVLVLIGTLVGSYFLLPMLF